MIVLETPRLKLRTLTLDDVDNVLGIFSDPIATKYYPSTLDRSQVIKRLQRSLDRYQADGYSFWACIRQSDGEYLGNCGLLKQEVEGRNYVEVGYQFLRRHWGQGYASEAAIACRDHAFETLEVDEVISLIVEANEPSIRVAQRNGMTLSFQTRIWDSDLGVYKITRSEWESLKNG
ncbi:MAG: GNAT family N-acetyltransferase [Planctomycetota bacterium]|nr:GNAT family N-acetyltransferase [Planctomycetota bacterium]